MDRTPWRAILCWPGTGSGCGPVARQKHAELFRSETIFLEGLGRTGPYLTRKVEPTKVQVSGLATHLPVGVFPASNTNRTFERVSRLYPAAHPVENALSVALLNADKNLKNAFIMGVLKNW